MTDKNQSSPPSTYPIGGRTSPAVSPTISYPLERTGFDNASRVLKDLQTQLNNAPSGTVALDLHGVVLNTAARSVIRQLHAANPGRVQLPRDLSSEILYRPAANTTAAVPRRTSLLERMGGAIIRGWHNVLFFLAIVVDMLVFSFEALYNRRHIVRHETIKNIHAIGYRAIPIVTVLSFLIGLVITLQAGIQMAKFGGQGFLATLIGTAMFKELGPLITAVIIAGRTGSAIAAEIGTMVVMEEVDALRTMGVKPLKFLLVPKFNAFTLSMPILTMISSLAGIAGGLVVSVAFNVPAASFMSQIGDTVNSHDLIWAVIKSLSFAWVILAIACYKGLQVRGGADAVGRATTDSVVISIFMVVVVDALFSLILYT